MRNNAIATTAVAVLVMFATGCEEVTREVVDQAEPAATENVTNVEQPADEADAPDQESDSDGPYRIGDKVAMGDLEHALHGARWSTGDDLFGPDEGERWLVLDIEVTNTGDSSEAMSSLIMWSLVDEENRSADITITGDERGSLDGELGAGRSIRGELAYSLPDDGSGTWELLFEPQVFGFGQALYIVTDDDVAEN